MRQVEGQLPHEPVRGNQEILVHSRPHMFAVAARESSLGLAGLLDHVDRPLKPLGLDRLRKLAGLPHDMLEPLATSELEPLQCSLAVGSIHSELFIRRERSLGIEF